MLLVTALITAVLAGADAQAHLFYVLEKPGRIQFSDRVDHRVAAGETCPTPLRPAPVAVQKSEAFTSINARAEGSNDRSTKVTAFVVGFRQQ